MKRKTLYALTMLLFLSSVAFPNENSRFHCWASGNCPAAPKGAAASPRGACVSKDVSGKDISGKDASGEETSATSGIHVLLHTFIKLLYI